MLACLFSEQLGLRSDIDLQRRAIIELDIIMVAPHKGVGSWTLRRFLNWQMALRVAWWLYDETEKGNHKTTFVRMRQLKTSAFEEEAVGKERSEFDGEAWAFKPLVVLPTMMLPVIAMDSREKRGLRRVLARIMRRF
jgi:hypothetical protein